MRDLEDLYVRANTCVACHQNIDSDLLQVGHPELIFELDGQGVTQPKHWREHADWHGPQAWLLGQAVALREISWKLALEKSPDEHAVARWRALLWLLQNAGAIADLPSLVGVGPEPTTENLSQTRQLSDRLARRAASLKWSVDLTKKCLSKLAATAADFSDLTVSQITQARRAERLVLGLDRLSIALGATQTHSALDAQLNAMFHDTQSVPDFKPAKFAGQLAKFKEQLQEVLSTP
jgi:hypothetical protein